MMTQCPTCGKCYDIPDKAVIKHAARIMQRHSRKGTPAQIEASRANGRLSHGRPRKNVTAIVRAALEGGAE